MNSYRLEEPNTFHLKVETSDEFTEFDINYFIALFIDDASLGVKTFLEYQHIITLKTLHTKF